MASITHYSIVTALPRHRPFLFGSAWHAAGAWAIGIAPTSAAPSPATKPLAVLRPSSLQILVYGPVPAARLPKPKGSSGGVSIESPDLCFSISAGWRRAPGALAGVLRRGIFKGADAGVRVAGRPHCPTFLSAAPSRRTQPLRAANHLQPYFTALASHDASPSCICMLS